MIKLLSSLLCLLDLELKVSDSFSIFDFSFQQSNFVVQVLFLILCQRRSHQSMFQVLESFWQSLFASLWFSSEIFNKCVVLFGLVNEFSKAISLFISFFLDFTELLSQFLDLFDLVFECTVFVLLFSLFSISLRFIVFSSDLFLT